MSTREKFDEFIRLCKVTLATLNSDRVSDLRVRIARAYEEFLNSLPEDRRNDTLVTMSGRAVPRTEIPRLILEDDEFFMLILRVYGR